MFLQELSRAIRALQDARRECIACHAALAGDACTLVMKSLDGRVSDKQDPSECITFVSLFCYQKVIKEICKDWKMYSTYSYLFQFLFAFLLSLL